MPLAIVHMYSYMVASCIAICTSGPGWSLELPLFIPCFIPIACWPIKISYIIYGYLGYIDVRNR